MVITKKTAKPNLTGEAISWEFGVGGTLEAGQRKTDFSLLTLLYCLHVDSINTALVSLTVLFSFH